MEYTACYPLTFDKARFVKAAIESLPHPYLQEIPRSGNPCFARDFGVNVVAAVAKYIHPMGDSRSLTMDHLGGLLSDADIELLRNVTSGLNETPGERYSRVLKIMKDWAFPVQYKVGDTVIVRAGSIVNSESAKLRLESKKNRVVELVGIDHGFAGSSQGGKSKRDAQVQWLGQESFLCWTHPDNVSIALSGVKPAGITLKK